MADISELIADIKRVASELRKTPSRDEYLGLGRFSNRQIRNLAGSFTIAIKNAGLDPPKKKRVTNEIFQRDIEQCVSEAISSAPQRFTIPNTFESILVIGDTHFPFAHNDTLSAIYAFAEKHNPSHVVQVGDLHDMFSHSKFPASKNIYTPRDEMELAYAAASSMWSTLRKICPRAKLYGLRGNHCVRPLKRLMESYPEGEIFFSIDKWFQFEGVQDVSDYRQELVIQDIVFHHGYKSRLGQHLDHNLANSVVGHTHKGGVHYRAFRNQTLWELNAGLAGDPATKVFSYTPQKTTLWTLGFGWIDEWGPRFIPT